MTTPRFRHERMANGRCAVVKYRPDAPPGFFAAEACGLAALREAGALRVPAVFEVDQQHIALEDLGEGPHAADYWQRAGTGLAAQHSVVGARFGFDHDGYCGDSAQDNTPDEDGGAFSPKGACCPRCSVRVSAAASKPATSPQSSGCARTCAKASPTCHRY